MADITVNQLVTQTFYQIPQIFMTTTEKRYSADGKIKEKIKLTSKYAKALSNDAKLAYGALYNRCLLSIRSYNEGRADYIDENGSVFMIYTVDDLMDLLDRGKTTVLKIKKELVTLGLLREVSQGANRPNRLYLQNVEASFQEKEVYVAEYSYRYTGQQGRKQAQVTFHHVKTLNYLNEVIVDNHKELTCGGSDSEPPTNPILSSKNGGSKNGRPLSGPREVQKMDPINTDKTKTDNNDTNRYKEDSFSVSEAFQLGNHSFLNESTTRQLATFGELAPLLQDKIFQAKRAVEKEFDWQLQKRFQGMGQPRLTGELFSTELNQEVAKLRSKVSIGKYRENPIRDSAAYFYRMLVLFWKKCLYLELHYSFLELDQAKQRYGNLLEYLFPDSMGQEELDNSLYLWELAVH